MSLLIILFLVAYFATVFLFLGQLFCTLSQRTCLSSSFWVIDPSKEIGSKKIKAKIAGPLMEGKKATCCSQFWYHSLISYHQRQR